MSPHNICRDTPDATRRAGQQHAAAGAAAVRACEPVLGQRTQVFRGAPAARRVLRDHPARDDRHGARLLRVRLHPRHAHRRRRHESFHAAARRLAGHERLGRGRQRRHALRQRRHGAADQRHPQARRPPRESRDQAGGRRARARGHEHRHRRAQHRVRAPVREGRRIQGRRRRPGRHLSAPGRSTSPTPARSASSASRRRRTSRWWSASATTSASSTANPSEAKSSCSEQPDVTMQTGHPDTQSVVRPEMRGARFHGDARSGDRRRPHRPAELSRSGAARSPRARGRRVSRSTRWCAW